MGYPKTLTAISERNKLKEQKEVKEEKKLTSENNKDRSKNQKNSDDKSKSKKDESSKSTDSDEGSKNSSKSSKEKETSSSLFDKGKLTKDITVHVASGSAEEAASSLVKAKIFASFDDYKKVCSRENINPSNIKTSTFTFSKGMTKGDIVREVTK